jgi:thymidylate kinase
LPEYLLRAVVDGDWAAVERCAPAVRDVEGSVPLPQRIVRRAWSSVQRAVASDRRRGLSVAVLGPDGAGKSTLVAGICASIPLPSRIIYMGLSGGALRHARRLRIPGLVFAATAAIIWSRYLRARYHQARGRLVVFDRYIYDAVAPHPNRLNPAQRLSRFLAGHLCPGPDMMVLLDAPGSVMYARKGAYTAATLENWRWHFRALASRSPSSHVIDATRSADAVKVDVLTALWRRQRERWAV